jgi:bifunctional DNA-binding transcriptional regulator/antitoxin component of YhaV-PrlF toxin-antitoxin module
MRLPFKVGVMSSQGQVTIPSDMRRELGITGTSAAFKVIPVKSKKRIIFELL